ncbi:MAG: Fpg/Nei family DNA glycosylase [Candidatus Helarchaeota archaeon]
MPELPDIEAIIPFLREHVLKKEIISVDVPIPICIRTGKKQFIEGLINKRFSGVCRFGKFIVFSVADLKLAINFMLAGRLQYNSKKKSLAKKVHFSLELEDESQLWYFDQKRMGKIYLVPDLKQIPGTADFGPDIMEISQEQFMKRIKKFRGSIKKTLMNQKFVTGIGNAYSDEILFSAGIYPFRKCTDLSADEIKNLYHSSKEVLINAIETLRERIGTEIEVEIRDFLNVHRKGGQPCPKCGKPITEITADRRIISYCKKCQL